MSLSESKLERYRALKRGALRSTRPGSTVSEKLLAVAAKAEGIAVAAELNAAALIADASPKPDDLALAGRMEVLETDSKLRSYWHWCCILLDHKINPLEKLPPELFANNPSTDYTCTELLATEIEQQLKRQSAQELKIQAVECRNRAKSAKTETLARFWREMQIRTEDFVGVQVLQNLAREWSEQPNLPQPSPFLECVRNGLGENELEFTEHRLTGSGLVPEFVAVAVKSESSTYYVDPQRRQFREPWLSPAVCGYKFTLFFPDLADDETPTYGLRQTGTLSELSFTAPYYQTCVFRVPAEEWSSGKFDSPKTIVKYENGCLFLGFTFQRFTRK